MISGTSAAHNFITLLQVSFFFMTSKGIATTFQCEYYPIKNRNLRYFSTKKNHKKLHSI